MNISAWEWGRASTGGSRLLPSARHWNPSASARISAPAYWRRVNWSADFGSDSARHSHSGELTWRKLGDSDPLSTFSPTTTNSADGSPTLACGLCFPTWSSKPIFRLMIWVDSWRTNYVGPAAYETHEP